MDKRISLGEHEKHRRGMRFFKSESRSRLFEKSNLTKLIFALLTVGIFSAFAFYIFDVTSVLYSLNISRMTERSWRTAVTALRTLIGICSSFTVFGLFCGFYMMCVKIYENGNGAIGLIFYVFESKKRLRRAICAYVMSAVALIPTAVLAYLSMNFAHESRFVRTCVISAALCIGIFIFLIFVFFMLAYPLCREKTFLKKLKSSFAVMKNHIFSCFVLTLSFIPLIIISVLSFGILFIIYTVPYTVLSFAVLGSYAFDRYKYGITGG